jgi:nicotinate phosphoribosyltransferase
MKYDLTPVGSYPHELPMALSTIYGEEDAQYEAIKLMKKEFPTRDVYALTDTYTTDLFLSRFWTVQNLCAGVRHDSGCPFAYTDKIIQWYKDHGIDPRKRTILYTDNLNCEKKNNIIKYVGGRIQTKFGIGTYLTNICEDRPDSVIKLVEVNGQKVRKISDDPTKSIGDIQ